MHEQLLADSSTNFNVHLKCIVLSEEASIKSLVDSIYMKLRQKRLPWWLGGKESACNAGDEGDKRFDPYVGKFLWRRAWQHTPVFLPGESHRQRSLVGHN